MEDLKLRLLFDDINVRSRCLQKLSNNVKKKTKGTVLNSSSMQIPELNLILETCEDDSASTSLLAVQAIVSLAKEKCMSINYAVTRLLGAMKSTSNYQSVISGISTLLIHEYNLVTENKVSKYSLYYPQHPLIAALETKEDCFLVIAECLSECLSLDFKKSIQTMEPVICYILCDPSDKQDLSHSKLLFLDNFFSRLNDSTAAIQFAFKYVPVMQVMSLHQVAEVSNFILKLYDVLSKTNSPEQDFTFLIESLLLVGFSLIERSINVGHSPSQIIEFLMQLCPLLPKLKVSPMTVNKCFVLIAYSLHSASGSLLEKISMLGMKLLENADVSPHVAAIVALSVVHFLPESSLTSSNDSTKIISSRLLRKLESVYLMSESGVDKHDQPLAGQENGIANLDSWDSCQTFSFLESFTPAVQAALTCVKFSAVLDKSHSTFKVKWLDAVKSIVDSGKTESYNELYSLVSALFLVACEDDEALLLSCFEALESLLTKAPDLSTRAFSLLMYKLSCMKKPKSKFMILDFLPKSATHKYSISPVLGVLQMMANEVELKAQAIHLVLQLWKKQSRCFPYLQILLTESNKPVPFDSGVNEVLIAQAASILEICSTEPEKHGHEFLNALSTIFNKCNDEASTPVACLAIKGIIMLCKSEVIDIRSTWKALSAKLSRDKRSMVSCRMYELLSLVPELRVRSHEYDKFMTEAVTGIWKQISAGTLSPPVLAEAYKTLSKFPMDCHVLKQLPAAAKANLKLPASMKATPFEMSKLPEDVLSYIPGYCFVDLLLSYEDETILEGYATFLQSILKMEVEELPRSVYSQTRHVNKRKKVNEALSKVPEFLCTLFHSRKSPALQKNLAVGVLFCYEPPIEVGRDGLPLKRSIAQQYRSYEQVLTVLLNEVNIDANEWHRCILISNGWRAFMERALFACEEARKVELELQRYHGHHDGDTESLHEQCKLAWLWIRDRFIGIIKTNVKSTPTAHANSVFAIAGLVFALDKFYSSLDESSKTLAEVNEKYTYHRHFISEYVETLICAVHSEYQPTVKVQSWLLTHLSRPNSSAAYLVTGCASSSLCHLAPILASQYVNDIRDLFKIMLKNVGHSSPVLSFYSGKGIGLLIKALSEVGYFDSGETQVNLILHVVREMMKMFEDSENSLPSCLIGLTLSVTSLSHIADEDIKDWVSTTCNIFFEKLMDEEKSSMKFEMLCICVTAMIIGAAEGGCLPLDKVEDLASWIEMNKLDSPQCSGISVSLGMLIEAFERFGHSDGAELKQKVLKGWLNTVTSERKPTLQKIAALNGLCSLFSCGRGLIQVKSQPTAESTSALNELVPVLYQILNAPKDTGLQGISSWEVGRLFAVNSHHQQAELSVPASYSYLGEKSILKHVMNVILNNPKEGEKSTQAEEISYKHCHVLICLKSLASPFARPLPPINWTPVLTPYVEKSDADLEAIEYALKLAVYQCGGSPSARNIVSSYCCPPLIHTLPESSFKIFVDNIPALTLALPPAKSQVYLQTIISHTVKRDDALKVLGNSTLKGLLISLKQSGYKEQSRNVLQDAFISIFKHFKRDETSFSEYLPWIVKCLLCLPDEKQSSLLQLSQNPDEVAIITMIWCYLIKAGKKPLASLRSCIEEGKTCSSMQKEKICSYIYDCFLSGSHNKKSETSQPDKCISWLLETIGWIRVLEDSKSKFQLLSAGEVYTFLVDVCIATIVGCSGLENSCSFLPEKAVNHFGLLQALPQALGALSRQNEWNVAVNKIIEWLLMLTKSQHIKESEKYFTKLSLCSLRSTSQFQKKEVWTEAVCNVITME